MHVPADCNSSKKQNGIPSLPAVAAASLKISILISAGCVAEKAFEKVYR
jgi:hypothetical protein